MARVSKCVVSFLRTVLDLLVKGCFNGRLFCFYPGFFEFVGQNEQKCPLKIDKCCFSKILFEIMRLENFSEFNGIWEGE